jgi:hypothetical protein
MTPHEQDQLLEFHRRRNLDFRRASIEQGIALFGFNVNAARWRRAACLRKHCCAAWLLSLKFRNHPGRIPQLLKRGSLLLPPPIGRRPKIKFINDDELFADRSMALMEGLAATFSISGWAVPPFCSDTFRYLLAQPRSHKDFDHG